MGTSTARTLIGILMVLFGILVPARSLWAADVEIIVRYGPFGVNDPVSEFKNAQGNVTTFIREPNLSRFRWGDPEPVQFGLTFATGGLVVEQGVRIEANFRQVFSLGRLIRINGLTKGGEATAVDLQIAVTLSKPAGVDEPLLVTLPLTIAHTRESREVCIAPDGHVCDTAEEILVTGHLEVVNFALGSQVSLPATLPSVEFTAGGAKYKLRLIGFVSITGGTPVSSLVDDPVHSADLLAVIEPPCPPENVTPVRERISGFAPCGPNSLGNRMANYGSFGWKDVLEANSGDKLELECVDTTLPLPVAPRSASYKLFFTKAGSSERVRVGFCPFEAGCNIALFFHSGDNDNGGAGDGKPDCFLQVQWISKDYGDNDKFPVNPWTKEFEPFDDKLDWAETFYDVTTGQGIKMDHKYNYNLGPPVTTLCAGSDELAPAQRPEGNYVGSTVVDPLLGPETEAFYDEVEALFAQISPSGFPMGEDRSKLCDFNGDGRCDAADVQIFEAALGSCRGDANYHPQADTDGSGCVDARDRFYLFEADRDGDGIRDTADNCLTVANPDQSDSNGDGVGDACTSGVVGDLDNDGDVDLIDLKILLNWRNTAAAGPNDPKDLDHDGRITVLDARKLILRCTRPNCATQ